MKKQYMQPTAVKVAVKEALMHTGSIQNTNGDVQNPINPNDDANFEAGAKKHDNLWDKWDD